MAGKLGADAAPPGRGPGEEHPPGRGPGEERPPGAPREGSPNAGARAGAAAGRLPPGEVRDMFDRIATVYDAMNTAMTAGLHHRWRARAAELTCARPGERVLDLATGTGDLAFALAQRVSPGGEVVGCDFSEAMLARARAKAPGRQAAGVQMRFELADALSLPYAADSFDAASVGFGARNFQDLQRAFRELARVVRGGGRVVVLEITTPLTPPLSSFYRLWFDALVPALGRAAGALSRLRAPTGPGAGEDSARTEEVAGAYTYLPNSVKRFPAPAELALEMEHAGLGEVAHELLAGGIVAIHTAIAPARAARIQEHA